MQPRTMIDRWATAIDHYQRRHRFVSFIYATLRKYNDDEAGHRVVLLTYYSFLALFPLLLIFTSILKLLIFQRSNIGTEMLEGVLTYFPVAGQAIKQNLGHLHGTGLALAISTLLTLYGARGVADAFRSSLDHLWQVPVAQRSRLPMALLKSLGVIVVGGIGLSVTPLIVNYSTFFGRGFVFQALSVLISMFMLFWIIVAMAKVAISVHQPLGKIWVGAALAAIGLEVLQGIGTAVMSRELQHLDYLYGAFALVLGLMFWLYLQMQVVLLAFEADTVRVFRLWPRSIVKPLTEADHAAYQLYSDRAQFHDEILEDR